MTAQEEQPGLLQHINFFAEHEAREAHPEVLCQSFRPALLSSQNIPPAALQAALSWNVIQSFAMVRFRQAYLEKALFYATQ